MKYFTIIAAFLIISSCNEEDVQIASTDLISYDNGSGIQLNGTARITYVDNIATITISLINQNPGSLRSVHIYDGTCENPGDIWNTGDDNYCETYSLDEKWFKPNLGDVGNITVKNDGTASFSLSTDLWSLNTGEENDIAGKIIVIHSDPVNFLEECDPNHIPDHFHPNIKIACGTFN